MRIIRALLVLLFLAPTLAAAEPNPESSFLRIQRDESRDPVALQTVIAKYVPASGAKGVEIDLVAVVHIGEKAYYQRLNKEFEKYDTVLLGVVAAFMPETDLGAAKPPPQTPDISLNDLLNPTMFKTMMAQRFGDAGGDVVLGRTVNQLLVEDRNKACMKVLQQQLAAGKKKIAIFYGAAHMPDFAKRLKEDFDMKRTTSEWIDAWNLADDGPGNR